MGLIDIRALLQYGPGDNSTDTVVNGVHLNKTALDLYKYAIYDNGTISNESSCYLIFGTYQPTILSNGSWINGTSCYRPYYGIKERGKLSIAFAACFAISIMFTLINLRKHGRLFVREDKRFRAVGRRWSWYWMLFVAACAMISTITGVDVDRNYLPSLAIVLQSFFFTLMVPGALAIVWEATRHWGSWLERQICDRDPFLLPQDDKRGKTEFWLPLVFYLFAWMNFFMTVPRSWGKLERQRSPEQQLSIAKPNGTDTRLKAGAILAACAWLVICFSLLHSIKHYKTNGSSILGGIGGVFRHTPWKLSLSIIVLAVRLGYGVLAAWDWDTTLFNLNVNLVWPFAFGFGTVLLIIVIFNVAGYIDENEDKVLIQQRRDRGRVADAELGITKKPNWWSKLSGNNSYMTDEQRLRAMTTELGGGRPTGRNISEGVELSTMSNLHSSSVRNRSQSRPRDRSDPFRDPSPAGTTASTIGPPPYTERSVSDTGSVDTGTSGVTGTTLNDSSASPRQQRIRSMLDV